MPHECTDCGRQFADGSKEMLSGCPNCGGNTFQFRPQGTASERTDADEPQPEPSDILEAPPEPAANNSVARTVGNAAMAVRDLVGSNDPPAGHPMAEGDSPAEDQTVEADSLAENQRAEAESPAENKPTEADAPADDSTVEVDSIQSPTPQQPRESASSERVVPERQGKKEQDGRDSDTPEIDSRDETSDSESRSDVSDVDREDADSREDTAQASARSEVVSPDDLPPPPETSVRQRPAPVVDESSERTGAEDRPNLDELRKQLNEQFESIRVVAPGQYELNLMELFDREEYIIALQEDGKYTIQVPERWNE